MRRSTFVSFAALASLIALLAAGVSGLHAQGPGQPRPGQPPPGQAPPGGPPQGAPPAGQPGRPGMGGMMGMMPPDTAAAERDSLMDVVLKKIAGKEDAPAESVFKDIQVLKDMTAGRVVRVMNLGFGRSLGVGCFYCHDRQDWAKSDSRHKKAARDMWKMVGTINNDLLAKMENIGRPGSTEKPIINCTTCHRGSTRVGPPRQGQGGPPGGPPPGR